MTNPDPTPFDSTQAWPPRHRRFSRPEHTTPDQKPARPPKSTLDERRVYAHYLTNMKAIAKKVDVPFMTVEDAESICRWERSDASTDAIQRQVLRVIVDHHCQLKTLNNQLRRVTTREVLDGVTAYGSSPGDDDTVVFHGPVPAGRKPHTNPIGGVPPAPTRVEDARAMLDAHTQNPKHATPLTQPDGRAILEDTPSRSALRVTVKVVDGILVDGGFHSFGHPLIRGCMSFLLEAMIGRPSTWVSSLHPGMVAHVLRVESGDICWVRLAVKTLQAAVASCPRPRRKKAPGVGRRGAPRGHRKVEGGEAISRPTRYDVAMLRPGEAYAELMQEREQIRRALEHLGECQELVEGLSPVERAEADGPLAAVIETTERVLATLPHLTAAEQELLRLIGMDELSGRAAAEQLEVDERTVRKRMASITRRIHALSRDHEGIR